MNALRLGLGLRQDYAAALTARLTGGKLRLYTGALPATPDSATTETLLCEVVAPAVSIVGGTTIEVTFNYTAVQSSGTAGRFLLADSLGSAVIDGPVYLETDPAAPAGALLLPLLALTVNVRIFGTLSIPITMVA